MFKIRVVKLKLIEGKVFIKKELWSITTANIISEKKTVKFQIVTISGIIFLTVISTKANVLQL